MSADRLYFDNAATSFPKPPAVVEAVRRYFDDVHASAGRGAYREAVASARILDQCRAALRRLFECAPGDHVIFTLNGTDALNLAIKSIVRPGDHVVTTALDHNSVLRPLAALERQRDITWTAVPFDSLDDGTDARPDGDVLPAHPASATPLDPEQIRAAMRPNTRLVAINHASNVTGVVQPIEAVGRICRERGVVLLVDAAQSAGHVPIDFGAGCIDLLAAPGHKGLLGPLGTGVLLIRAGVEKLMDTVREGGTGSASEQPHQPERLPDRFEAGSHNAPGIAGLLASTNWLLERGVAASRAHEIEMCERMMARLDAIARLTWFGPRTARERVGVFSLRAEGLMPDELSALLESSAGVLSRSGLHCAPLAHRACGTLASGGTTRLSFGAFTTGEDIDHACDALAAIVAEHRPAAVRM